MSFDLDTLRTAIARHGPLVRIVITEHNGSTPRETGTAMLVWANGQDGTIGGGELEWRVVATARARLAAGASRWSETYPLGPALGQCCGGSVGVMGERWDLQAIDAVLDRAATSTEDQTARDGFPDLDGQGAAGGSGLRRNSKGQGQPTESPAAPDLIRSLDGQGPAVGSGIRGDGYGVRPAFIARRMAGGPTVTDPSALPFLPRKAAQSIRDGRSDAAILVDGWFIEPLTPSLTPLWIYGAGHVGRAIAGVMGGLPFDTTLVDTAPGRFPATMLPGVTPLLAVNPADAVSRAPLDAIHIVLTYSHAYDLEVCHRVLARPFRHLGLIGSATKAARFRKRLAELGHAPATIARLSCPIGDRSLGKSPQAIAIGVAAELIRLTRSQTETLPGTAVHE
ncbi:MAG: XdhC family protein [Rubricella sp.]